MKCKMAVFKDISVDKGIDPGFYQLLSPDFVRAPVECGGEIDVIRGYEVDVLGTPIFGITGYCCTKCGVRYEKLPEELL